MLASELMVAVLSASVLGKVAREMEEDASKCWRRTSTFVVIARADIGDIVDSQSPPQPSQPTSRDCRYGVA